MVFTQTCLTTLNIQNMFFFSKTKISAPIVMKLQHISSDMFPENKSFLDQPILGEIDSLTF